MRSRFSKTRGGFTIVELLVAAGVSLLLMVIITEAFKRGIDMFRTMRAQGTMQERLRTAATTLRDDLAAHHLPLSVGSPYISAFTSLDNPPWAPPQDGFFRIYQGPMMSDPADPANPTKTLPFIPEGTDRDGMLFTRATTHILHFSVLRKGTSPDNMFRTFEPFPWIGVSPAPTFVDPPVFCENGVFSSRWAEVSYFLSPNGDNANGTLLYNLYRRQQLLIPSAVVAPNVAPAAAIMWPVPSMGNQEISTRVTPTGNFYNSTHDVTQPRNRFGVSAYAQLATDPNAAGYPAVTFPPPAPPNPNFNYMVNAYPMLQAGLPFALPGDDIILADVISFEVKALWSPITTVLPIDGSPSPTYTIPNFGTVVNSDYPFDYLPLSQRNTAFAGLGMRVFDTWSSNDIYGTWDQAPSPVAIPLRIKMKAVLIRIRIWDAKSEQTRQLTIIQDL